MRHPGAFGPSWIEINGSDQNRAVSLEMTSQYLINGYSLNCLPVFLKSTLQVPWMEATTGLGQVFKRCTGYGASDSAVPMACIESHRLSEGGPKEIIFEFNQMPLYSYPKGDITRSCLPEGPQPAPDRFDPADDSPEPRHTVQTLFPRSNNSARTCFCEQSGFSTLHHFAVPGS